MIANAALDARDLSDRPLLAGSTGRLTLAGTLVGPADGPPEPIGSVLCFPGDHLTLATVSWRSNDR